MKPKMHSSVTCNETFDYSYVSTGTPQGAKIEWHTNSCNWQGRPHIKCWDQLTDQLHNYNGGWVRPVGFVSAVNCPVLGQELVKAGFEDRVGPGGSVANRWFYIRFGFMNAGP